VNRAAQALAGLVAVFRNENLRRLELAWGAAITAEWAHFVALGVFAYDAGGAVGVGIAGLVRMLPAALVAPFAASLGDRFRRERFLVGIALVGAAALAASAVVFFMSENAPAIFALAAVVGLSATLVRPAQQARLPSLARTPEELIGSNGATSTIESLGTLVGPLLAGVLVSVADAGVVFAVGAGALLVSALLFFRVRVEGRLRTASQAGTERAHRLLLAGLAYVARTPTPRMVVGLVSAQAFVRGCLNVLIVVTAFRVLDGNAAAVGYMTAALGVGRLLGALAAFRLEGRRLAVAFGIALVFWGLPIALMASSSFLAPALLLLAVVGAANTLVRRPDGSWYADNTDVPGMVRVLADAGLAAVPTVTVLGGGGTARAAVAAAARLGAVAVTVVTRRPEAREELAPVAAALGVRLVSVDWVGAPAAFDADAVISTVPKGAADALATAVYWAGLLL